MFSCLLRFNFVFVVFFVWELFGMKEGRVALTIIRLFNIFTEDFFFVYLSLRWLRSHFPRVEKNYCHLLCWENGFFVTLSMGEMRIRPSTLLPICFVLFLPHNIACELRSHFDNVPRWWESHSIPSIWNASLTLARHPNIFSLKHSNLSAYNSQS